MEKNIITTRLRLKDKNTRHLKKMVREVNLIWNHINELTSKRRLRWNKWVSNSDTKTKEYLPLITDYDIMSGTSYKMCVEDGKPCGFLKGASKYFSIPQATIILIGQEHFKDRNQAKRSKLRFRGQRSGGWVPIRKDSIKHTKKQVGNKFQHTFIFCGLTFNTFKDKDIEGEIRFASFVEKDGKWYINVSYYANQRECLSNDVIGLDWGIKNFLSSSDKELPNIQNEEECFQRIKAINAKIVKLQRRISHQEEYLRTKHNLGNNGRIPKKLYTSGLIRNRKKLEKLHNKVYEIRKDFIHKATHTIAENYTAVCIENLKVKNMSKSAKGTVKQHGKNVKAKSGLNREILNKAPYETRRQLEYKMKLTGGDLIAVDPEHTSQTCSKCGYRDKENRKGSDFRCLQCGFVDDADHNASINILHRGISSQ